ncbi:hypothetical protein B0H10DRAFT_945875 [Mycena sp. CBHHK59/15]|nr:hypothetical protein B0H10DRAFT_945875 [Mycena sp. CBHHK59/15]
MLRCSSMVKKVVSLPIFFLLVTTALGYVTVYQDVLGSPSDYFDSRIVFSFAITTNLLITGLAAGRIWWTRRDLKSLGQTLLVQRYNTAILILLESGAENCLVIVIVLVAVSFQNPNSTGTSPGFIATQMFYGACAQLVNIVPTLFIVRVGLRRNMDSSGVTRTSNADKPLVV